MNTVEEYLSAFNGEVLDKLIEVRKSILSVSSDIEELISYKMPAYKYKGKILVYFAGYKNHVGFYATPQGHEAFAKQLSGYKQGKGSVQFPHSEALPLDLIKDIVKFKMERVD